MTARTPARRELLLVLVRNANLTWQQRLARINQLPGPAISTRQVLQSWWCDIQKAAPVGKVARKPAVLPSRITAGTAMASPFVQSNVNHVPARTEAPPSEPVLPPVSALGYIIAPYGQINAWCAWHGIAFDGTNVEAVNRIRTARGLPDVAVGE